MADGFSVSEIPPLRSPIVILAFTGWSDTGTVSIDAAQRLIDHFNAERFLEVDPEDYYVFTDTRPTVSLTEEGLRELNWPTNEAWAARLEGAPNDLIIVKGSEPNFRWLTFANRFADAIMAHNPTLSCTIGARPAPTPHTRPIPVNGSSADPALARRFGLGPSRYQGPTGIVGVLHEVLRKRGLGLISLFANVPHYLNVSENPPGTLALLRALEPVIGMPAPVGDLEEEGVRFIERVEEASRGDDQIGGYIRTLEDQYGDTTTFDEPEQEATADLPSADDILRDVEDLLRGGSDT
ncbi:MAG TPA: PAC2 family protein [Tepidiformaceae bacterium]|nr:PAC2 family protein [Tepidiformaceae bacterium]